MAAPPRPPRRSAKGHGLTAQWHGIPVWLLAAGGAVFAYFLYEHFKSSSSSSSTTNPVTGTVGYGSGYPGNYEGGGGYGGGGGPYTSPGQPSNPTPVNGQCPSGYTYLPTGPCGTSGPTCFPNGASVNCPNQPSTPPPTSVPKSPGSTSISTVTPTQAATAQQILASQPPAENPVTTSTGQQTSTSQLAYQNLTSKGYSPQAASQIAQQIAAANSGVAPGTPQLVAGTPVVSGSTSATNVSGAMTPAQAAQANVGTPEQQAIAASAASNPQNFGGGWVNVGNGTIRNTSTGQVLPAGTNGIW